MVTLAVLKTHLKEGHKVEEEQEELKYFSTTDAAISHFKSTHPNRKKLVLRL